VNAPRYVLEDPSLPHQIVILHQRQLLAVSCNCLRTGTGTGRDSGHRAIAAKTRWEPGEAYAVWLGHMAEAGAVVA
jgi:hypothetical protein